MIEDFEDVFGPLVLQAMIEGRGEIQQNQRTTINTNADNLPGIPLLGSQRDQQCEGRNTEGCSDSVGNAVGNLFAKALGFAF